MRGVYARVRRPVPSITGHEVIPIHLPDGTLAEARNLGARRATQPWLCFLDADDELAPGYLDHMTRAIDLNGRKRALYVPQVQYVRPPGRRPQQPKFPAEVDYRDGNWLVIGTVIRTLSFHDVGGFEEWPLYEAVA